MAVEVKCKSKDGRFEKTLVTSVTSKMTVAEVLNVTSVQERITWWHYDEIVKVHLRRGSLLLKNFPFSGVVKNGDVLHCISSSADWCHRRHVKRKEASPPPPPPPPPPRGSVGRLLENHLSIQQLATRYARVFSPSTDESGPRAPSCSPPVSKRKQAEVLGEPDQSSVPPAAPGDNVTVCSTASAISPGSVTEIRRIVISGGLKLVGKV